MSRAQPFMLLLTVVVFFLFLRLPFSEREIVKIQEGQHAKKKRTQCQEKEVLLCRPQMHRPSLGTLCFPSSHSGFHSWEPGDEMGLPVVMSCRRNKLLNTSLYGCQISSLNCTICSSPYVWIRMKMPTSTKSHMGEQILANIYSWLARQFPSVRSVE